MAQISYLNQNQYTRGIRNNNPLNLIYSGIDWQGKIPYAQNRDYSGNPANITRHFEQFQSMEYGIRAAAMDLLNDYYVDGKHTIAELISERAPAFENDTQVVINAISAAAGVAPNVPFTMTFDILFNILKSSIRIEVGPSEAALVPDQSIVDAIYLIPGAILQKLGEYVATTVSQNKGSFGVLFGFSFLAALVYAVKKYHSNRVLS